jgi:two-component system nitrate/nitrite response regulator NarL
MILLLSLNRLYIHLENNIEMFQILIIDDHPLVGEGIKTMLSDVEWAEVSCVCKTGKEALEYIDNNMPNIILLDLNLPDIDGITLCERIRSRNKSVKIIGITSVNEAGIISQFLSMGANGYLLKNMERNELIYALEQVLGNNVYLSPAANQQILEQFRSLQESINSIPVLTRREREILNHLYEGYSGPQIAEKLFLSPYTVETHRKNLMQKLNVSNTQSLIRVAIDFKLITV